MARRIAGPTINWAAIAERVPEAQKPNFLAFKAKSDQYLRRMQANPETLPKFDWAYYKKNIPAAGLVDKFQKEFESLKIPYPEDKYTSAVEAQEKEVSVEIKKFVEESNQRIQNHEAELKKIRSLLPFEEMTLEDFADAYPDDALRPLDKPTFWPHTEDVEYTEEELKKLAEE
ncbi:ATP synthase subunit d, mitochondrial-like [Diprion similis]|uniref:ATP synthase subunit d, mitochondrial-like n=1 Tax=Diprion similis TaxID=362088 RepID=UPI001EF9B205|nr:ATP synthase subunit d, mitochondrial-like [Diprion similis]